MAEEVETNQELTEKEKAKKAKKDARKAKALSDWTKTMGILNAAETAISNYPDLNDINLDINLNYAGNPLIFLFTIFKHMKGYDEFIRVFSCILTPLCETLEYSVKAIFTARLTELLSCTLSNMRISEDLINNGFVINLKDVDLLNMLMYSPLANENTSSIEFFKKKVKYENGEPVLDKEGKFTYESVKGSEANIGKYYYFGCDDFEKSDDLVLAKDFNALLWYVKNRANGRVVWYGTKHQEFGQLVSNAEKQEKRDGILTLEYHDNGKSLIKADGSTYYTQVPSENCLHVFIGNTREIVDPITENRITDFNTKLRKLEKASKKYDRLISKIEKRLKYLNFQINQIEKQDMKAQAGKDYTSLKEDKEILNSYLADLRKGDKTVKQIFDNTGDISQSGWFIITIDDSLANFKKKTNEEDIGEIIKTKNIIQENDIRSYRPPEKNYYYNKFLMTFNCDYIWSVRLFDPKVVTAQLIDALTGCFSINANLSLESEILKAEVKKLVEEVCNDDSYEVNDCFFTFTNSGYNDLLEKTELMKMGLYKIDEFSNPMSLENAMDILSDLEEMSEKVDNTSLIESTLYKAAQVQTGSDKDILDFNVNGEVSFNFVENLMNKLATVIVTSVVSPKLYIMLLVNFQIMKLNTHFDIMTFINSYKQILIAIIRDVRDQLIKIFTEKVMEIFKDMIKELGYKMVMEQIQYYKNLITKCIGCINVSMRSNDWSMAPVDYADIVDEEEQPAQDNNNC